MPSLNGTEREIRDQIADLMQRWEALAAKARERTKTPPYAGYSPQYWIGMAFGLEMALEEIRQVITEEESPAAR